MFNTHIPLPVRVTNPSGFDWWTFLLGGFAGSFIAAIVVLSVQRYLDNRIKNAERLNQRHVLLEHLKLNLERISDNIQPYNVNKVILLDKIPATIVEPLLSGKTITYTEEPDLLRKLIDLNVAVSKYNDIVESYTLAQVTTVMTDPAHKQAYDNLKDRFDYMIKAKKSLLKDEGLKSI
jgi:hypothetical protein